MTKGKQRQVLKSPFTIIAVLTVLIFLIELLIMGLFENLFLVSKLWSSILDPILLSILIFPFFYFLVYKPFKYKIIKQERTNDALQKSLKEISEYKYALDGSTVIAITDQKGIIKKANSNFCKISKYSEEELIGQDHRIISSGYHSKSFIKNLWTTIANGNIWRGEMKNKAKDGTDFWLDTTIVPFLNEQGKPYQYLSIRADITLKKKNEDTIKEFYRDLEIKVKERTEELYKSEKRFRQIVETAQEGIWMIDVNNQTIFVNKKMCEILEYTEEEMMGRTNLSFKDAEEQKIALQQIKRIKKGIKETYESKFITKSGRHIYTQVSTNPILGEDGCYIGALAMMTDITGKKLADDELKKLSMVAKETINGVVIRDKDQNVLWVNNAFTKMFGYELDEVIGKNLLQFLPGPETDVEVLNYATEQLMQKEPFVFEILNYTKAGDKMYVSVQRQPIFDTNGDVKQFFALFTDITRQRELEEKVELEKNIKQKEITEAVIIAQESERSKIGRELHDNVNQLLGATKLYIDMGKRDDENRESLLSSASTYTLTAIEEIRKLSKILITPLIKEKGLTDSIKGLTKEIMLVHPIQILFTAKDFIEAGFSNKFKLNIFRIVQEQINNTLKHAQAKKININIEDNYGKLLISIADDGIGFDTSKIRTGIGITNIKSRSELYNGTMLLNSEQGKGTTLSITFNKTDLLLNNHNESNS